ncbi:hypothetical protein IP70_13275 [alpha proteobacterium AAP38]|nr:hypothetical protein IP70_13275 [alpha proteobacterium AAP38]
MDRACPFAGLFCIQHIRIGPSITTIVEVHLRIMIHNRLIGKKLSLLVGVTDEYLLLDSQPTLRN